MKVLVSDEEDVTVKHLNYCRNIIIIMVVVVVVVVVSIRIL